MDKRTFLRNAASLSLAPLAGRLLAAPAAGKSRFLLVFLRGGYDAANVLIPVSNGFYYESRPNIAVARESVLPLTSEWGLHPALGDTVYKLYQNGQAAFIPFAGTEDLSRSHLEAQDAIELGQGSARGFEAEARRVAKLMKEQFNVGFVDVGGWDTHVGEGGASGFLATRLEELGRGLAAFADEQGPAWQDTVVVLISEFGRTFRENGNRGTDHGHGTVFWVLGGGIRGGRIAGDQVPVRQETLFQNRDYAVLNEYRGVLGGIFARMYGLEDAQLERIFPGAKARDFALV